MNTSATDISVSVLNFKLWAAGRRITLAGTYVSRTQAREMREALAFWEVVHSCRKAPGTLCVPVLLHTFSTHHNPYLALVARLESLPTRVLRRVLWFYNIDFQSRESCLRRITSTQRDGVYETYAALYGNTPHIPTCFCSGVWDGLRQHLPGVRVTFSELLNGTFEGTERYRQKNAIAHDFGGLGWGFTLYKSTDIDDQVPESVTQQFLSPKNHHNDFTVNQEEGGVYWQLYSFVRSNYLWNRHGTVTLHRAICPGAYLTFTTLIVMFVCSPLLLLCVGVLWCISQIWRGLSALMDFVDERVPGIQVDREYWERVGGFLTIACVGTFISVVIAALWWGCYLFTNESVLCASVYTVFMVLYVTYMEHKKRWMLPTSVPYIGVLGTLSFLARSAFDYRAVLGEWLAAVGTWAYAHHLYLLGTSGIVMYLGLVFWATKRMDTWYDTTHSVSQQQRLERFYTVTTWLVWVLGLCLVGGAVWFLIHTDFSLTPAIAVGVMCTVMFLLIERVTTRYQPQRVYNRVCITLYDPHDCTGEYEAFSEKVIRYNEWLQTIDSTNLTEVLPVLWTFVSTYCYEPSQLRLFFFLDERGFAQLSEYREYFVAHGMAHRTYFLRALVEGKTVTEAKALLVDLLLKEERNDALYKRVSTCILACIDLVVHAWERIVAFFLDLNEIRKGFDKWCPRVALQEREIS